MLFDSTTYLIVSIIVPVCILAALGFLAYKKKKRWMLYVAVLGSGLSFGAMQVLTVQVYVYSAQEGIRAYRVLGSHTWKLDNGDEVTAGFQEIVKVTIINNSESDLLLEELVYTSPHRAIPFDTGRGEENILYISPYASEEISLPHNKIDYFFDEEIPESFEDYGAGAKSKYWLHK